MTEANSVSFKVYLESADNPEKPEVRRFGVDRDVVSNFSYLQEKLRTVFPSLRTRCFKVYWRDEDEDDVIISSDEELIIALSTMHSDVRKLFIKPFSSEGVERPAQQKDNGSTSHVPGSTRNAGEVHPNVVCDECDQSVRGFRYKCLQCADFDLCAECEQKGLHAAHTMLRLATPVHGWKPHYGRRFARHLSKANRHPGRGRCHGSPCEEEKESGKTEEAPRCGRERGHGYGNQAPWYIDMVQQLLADFTPAASAAAAAAAAATGSNEPAKEDGATSKAAQMKSEEYLRTVGETVAAFLDPLGINVHVDVEHGGQKMHCSAKDATKDEKVEEKKKNETAKNDEEKKNETAKKDEQKVTENKEGEHNGKKEAEKKVSFSSGMGDVLKPNTTDNSKADKVEPAATAKVMVEGLEPSSVTKTGTESGDGDWMIVTPEPQNLGVAEPSQTAVLSDPPKTEAQPKPQNTSVPSVTTSPKHEDIAAAAEAAMKMDGSAFTGQSTWGTYMGPYFPGSVDVGGGFRPPPFFPTFNATGAVPKQTQQQPPVNQNTPFSQGFNGGQAGRPLYPNLNPYTVPFQQMQPGYPYPRQPAQQEAGAVRTPRHNNPQIADAVDKMMSMGFSNEGGWLGQLLEIKGGDIDKALDVLQPVKKA